jgi:deazaflavin-dependent oxidoreductase (nitroreductase family)
MLTGLPVVTLTTTRANGDVRHTPLLGLPYGDDVVVIATSWGRPALPGWYRDVRREQRAELSMAARRYTVTPRELEGEERALLWKRACAMYAGYAAYERRIAGSRPIPLIVLSAL